jgi:hypothetical protein
MPNLFKLENDDSFVAAVNDLAARTNQSKAEVLRDAVNLYYRAVDEWQKNGRGIVFQPLNENPLSGSQT